MSHYHSSTFVDAAIEAGLKVTGVADPDASVAEAFARQLGCTWSVEYQDLFDHAKPDLVIAFAPHSDMPALGSFLIENGVPFMIEKPCGTRPDQVARLAEDARRKGAFAAIPFVWRYSHLASRLRRLLGQGDRLHYLSCRYIAGPPSRYLDNGCAWMLDPEVSGGGSTINLSVHFFDMFRWLVAADPQVSAARMSNSRWDYPVEDESVIVLEAPAAMCIVETGYHACGPAGADLLWTATTDLERDVASTLFELRVDRFGGGSETVSIGVRKSPYYLELIEDVITRLRRGERPPADLDDMLEVSRLVDAAYVLAGRGSRRFPTREAHRG